MNCVEACPKGLNPTRAIGKIKELFIEMLAQPDNDLLDWALGRGEPSDARYRPVVELLRAG